MRTCSVCGQTSPHTRLAARHKRGIAGNQPFAACPHCGNPAPIPTSNAYRQRVREFLAGARPRERKGLVLYARRSSTGGFHWVYREAAR